MSDLLRKLSAPFPASEVRQRPGGGKTLDYVGWDSVVRRLNDVVEEGWSLDIDRSSLSQVTKGEKSLWLAEVQVSLRIGDTRRGGVGAALMPDPDDSLKSAQAEALKKASNQYGMALELWTEEGREVVAKGRAAAKGDIGAMKALVFEQALAKGAEPNPESIAATLGVTVNDLQDKTVLEGLLA